MVRCNLVIDMQMTSEKINIQNKTKNLAKNSQGMQMHHCVSLVQWCKKNMKSPFNFYKTENFTRYAVFFHAFELIPILKVWDLSTVE